MNGGRSLFVEAPARLHFGVLDLRGDLGRRFGGIGAAVPVPSLLVAARSASALGAAGPAAARGPSFARRVAAPPRVHVPARFTGPLAHPGPLWAGAWFPPTPALV